MPLTIAGGPEARRPSFGAKVHAALADEGVTASEIADGTIGCDDLSPEVFPNGCPEYRFLQLTAIPVGTLTRTKLP